MGTEHRGRAAGRRSAARVLARACSLAVLLTGGAATAAATLEPVDGPCRVKLFSGRTLEATALVAVDATASFWRIELPGGGSVVLPVRQLKSVERLALEPFAADVPGVASPPVGLEPLGDCDPLTSEHLSRWSVLTTDAARRYGVDEALVQAIIAVESCGDPEAVSRKGAVGLMQLMPATARDYGCSDPKEPASNVDAGVRHLARLIEKLGPDLDLVLAAYNAGEGAVQRAGGIPRFRETQAYVRDVKRHIARLSAARSAAM